jgi:hypothetical protein
MAELAGLTLRERWGGWQREPFTRDSRRHVLGLGQIEDARNSDARVSLGHASSR